jgi:hypothetical protein
VIVDQLDNAVGHPISQLLVELVIDCATVKGLEVLAISRDREGHESRMLRAFTDRDFVELKCRDISPEQAVELLHRLGIDDPAYEVTELATNLLNLEVIATIKEQSPSRDFSDALNEVALWEEYMNALMARDEQASAFDSFHTAHETAAEATRLANQAVESDIPTFALDEPLVTSHRRLESWGVITNVEGHIYQFRHEKLQAYLYAKHAADNGWMPSDVLARVDSLKSRGILVWVNKIYLQRNSIFLTEWVKETFDV